MGGEDVGGETAGGGDIEEDRCVEETPDESVVFICCSC